MPFDNPKVAGLLLAAQVLGGLDFAGLAS